MTSMYKVHFKFMGYILVHSGYHSVFYFDVSFSLPVFSIFSYC